MTMELLTAAGGRGRFMKTNRRSTIRSVACTLLTFVGLSSGSASAPAAQAQAATAKTASAAKPAAQNRNRLLGTWRITRGIVAPWVTDQKQRPDSTTWIGHTIRFDASRVIGSEVLHCGSARYEATSVPVEGMFQGTMELAVKSEASRIGVSKFPIPGTSLTCDTGIFEFHYPDSSSALLALSNVIWTLDRSPGALAAAVNPAGVVQRFLETHFAGDMGFTKVGTQKKNQFFSASLAALMTRYFAVPANPNEAPDINGDPFTNSQEYPARFSVGAATTSGAVSSVRVRFSDASRVQAITFQLKLENKLWRIDDLKYDDKSSFRGQLTSALPAAR